MEFIRQIIDFILHIDQHLVELTTQYGGYIYGILFIILFTETGLVVTAILPETVFYLQPAHSVPVAT